MKFSSVLRATAPYLGAFILLYGLSVSAWAQSTLLQGGTWSAGRVPMYVGGGSSQPVVVDSGPAGGGGPGVGASEFGLTARGTGAAPFAGQGSGQYGTNWCDYDAPTTNPTGYHFFCISPNAQGGGLLAYGAGGIAAQEPLSFIVNGTTYPFPFSSGGVVGPGTSIINDVACWNNTNGTLLKDCGPHVTQIVAGTNVTISPSGGTGIVTINATGGGGGGCSISGGSQFQLIVNSGSSGCQTNPNATANAGTLTLGSSGVPGVIAMGNATSGSVTLRTVTGALGTSTSSFPAYNGTVITTTTGTPAQGDVLYFNGSTWVDLAPGTSGFLLETQGPGANPTWANVSSTGCTVVGGSQFQILINNGSSGCSSNANAVANAGALSLGASGTAGSIAMGNATSGTVTISPVAGALGTVTASLPANSGTVAELNLAQTYTAVQTFTNSDIRLLGSSTGYTIFTSANAGASNFTVTVPASTDTLVNLAGVQTLTNKSIAASEVNSGTLAAAQMFPLATSDIYQGNGSNQPAAVTLSAAIDTAIDNTQGDILYRGASGWTFLAPGTNGFFLETLGTSANPTWAAASGGMGCTISGGSQFQIIVNNGSSGCSSSPSASVNVGALTLGASGTIGTVALGNATSGTVTLKTVTGALGSVSASLPANTGVVAETNFTQTFTAAQSFTNADLVLLGSSSGGMTLEAPAAASTYIMTFPAATDTVVTLAATQTLTNKSISGSQINSGTVAIANGGTGATTLAAANIPVFGGSITATHCAEWSSSTALEDSGGVCGAVTATQAAYTLLGNATASPAAPTALTQLQTGTLLGLLTNVIAEGADPTGSADSTTAINAAFATCGAFIPPGTYKTTAPLTTGSCTNITIIGAGAYTTTININSTTAEGFINSATSGIVSGFNLGRVGTPASTANGFDFGSATNDIRLDGLVVNGQYNGIILGSSVTGYVYNTTTENNYNDGILMQNTSGQQYLQWNMSKVLSQGNNAYGIYVTTVGIGAVPMGPWINAYTFANSSGGVWFVGTSSAPIFGIYVADSQGDADGNDEFHFQTYATTPLGISSPIQLVNDIAGDAGSFATGRSMGTGASHAGNGYSFTMLGESLLMTSSTATFNSYNGVFIAGASVVQPNDGVSTFSIDNLQAAYNNIAGSTYSGLTTTGTPSGTISGGIFSNPETNKTQIYGINLANGTGITVTGGSAYNNATAAVNVTTGSLTCFGLQGYSSCGGGGGVSSFNTRTGAVTLNSTDVTTALGYSPVQSIGSGTNTTVSGTTTVPIVNVVANPTFSGTVTATTGYAGGALNVTGNSGVTGTFAVSSTLGVGGDTSLSGDIYMLNTKHLWWRNAANSAYYQMMTLDGTNTFQIGTPSINNVVFYNAANVLPSGNNTISLGASGFAWGGLYAVLPSSTSAQTGTVCYGSAGQFNYDPSLGCLTSSARFKMNIKPLGSALSEVMALKPVSFERKPGYDEGQTGEQVGLIAEDVAAVDPRLVGYDDKGQPLGVRYAQGGVALLLKAIQEQQDEITDLKKHMTPANDNIWHRLAWAVGL